VFENTYFRFYKRVFTFLSTDMSKNVKSRKQKFNPRSFDMSSQLRFHFTLNFFIISWLSSVFIVMVNQLFSAVK